MIRQGIVILIGLSVICMNSVAQITPVITSAKEKVLIGEPLKLKLELKAIDRNATVQWKIPDSIPHFEFVSYDTGDLFKREITVTSFDSGLWVIENIAVVVPSNVNDKPQLLKFPPKEILVEYDTTGNQLLNDVKPIIEVNAAEQWIGYAIAALALLSLIVLVILFRRWKKKQQQIISEEDSKYTALEEFQLVIEKLKQQSWSTQLEQKQHFSELSHAVKRYFERRLREPLARLTTDETMLQLKPYLVNDRLIAITQVFRLGDAVKFAKFTADQQDCINAVQDMEVIVIKSETELQAND